MIICAYSTKFLSYISLLPKNGSFKCESAKNHQCKAISNIIITDIKYSKARHTQWTDNKDKSFSFTSTNHFELNILTTVIQKFLRYDRNIEKSSIG